jgi:hypothetical protein
MLFSFIEDVAPRAEWIKIRDIRSRWQKFARTNVNFKKIKQNKTSGSEEQKHIAAGIFFQVALYVSLQRQTDRLEIHLSKQKHACIWACRMPSVLLAMKAAAVPSSVLADHRRNSTKCWIHARRVTWTRVIPKKPSDKYAPNRNGHFGSWEKKKIYGNRPSPFSL